MNYEFVSSFLDALGESLEELRAEVSDVRLGEIEEENGYINFEFRGETFRVLETNDTPMFSCKGDNSSEARGWALKQILTKKATLVA